jgi:hypothetical protein
VTRRIGRTDHKVRCELCASEMINDDDLSFLVLRAFFCQWRLSQTPFSNHFSVFVTFQSPLYGVSKMAGCFDHMWCGRLYHHIAGSAAGQIGQQTGTLDDGLDCINELVTVYEKLTLLAHVDLVKLICSLESAPFPLLR